MADKEYLLGNRARELLKYTNQATKVVTDDVSQKDVRVILQKIAALDDIREVKSICQTTIGQLDRKEKDGFTKAMYRCYGEDMRLIAKGIVRDVHAANGKMFATEYNERLRLIGKVLDVKYMTASWKKNDGARANKLRSDEEAKQDARQVEVVKTAIRQYNAEKKVQQT